MAHLPGCGKRTASTDSSCSGGGCFTESGRKAMKIAASFDDASPRGHKRRVAWNLPTLKDNQENVGGEDRGGSPTGFDPVKLNQKLWQQAEELSSLADVRIDFPDGSNLRAHRCILTAASPLYEGMFSATMRESASGVIEEQHANRASYREFLRYLYIGRCKSGGDVDCGHLYTMAKMHHLEELALWITRLIDGQSVALAAQFASDIQDEELLENCQRFAKAHFHAISHVTLKDIEASVVKGLMLQAPTGIDAFKFALGWNRANAGVDLQQDTQSLISLIEMSAIRAEDIKEVVLPSGLLPQEKVLDILLSRAISLEMHQSFQANWPKRTELKFLKAFGNAGSNEGQMDHPGGLVVSSSGDVIIADGANHRIQVFRMNGQFVRALGSLGHGVGQLHRPRDVCLSKDGKFVVADTFNNRVQIFNQDGSFLSVVGEPGTEPGQFSEPSGVAIMNDGNIVVADSRNHRIQIFNAEGEYQTHFGSKGSLPNHFNEPRGVAVDSQDNIIVSDTYNHRLQIFNSNGQFLNHLGSLGDDPGRCFRNPRKVAVGPNDDIVVADKLNHRIQVFRSDLSFVTEIGLKGDLPGQLQGPVGVAVSPKGKIVVTEFDNDRVQVFGAVGSRS